MAAPRATRAIPLTLLLLLLAGCGDFFTPRTDVPGSSSHRSLYVANFGAGAGNTVSAFSLDTSTGALTAIGTPVTTGTGPSFLVTDPAGKFLYVASDAGTISAFAINASSGALTAITGSPFPTGIGPVAAAVTPNSKFLYVANNGSNDISVFSIDATTGALTNIGAAFALGHSPVGITADPGGKFLYAPLATDGVAALRIATDGTLTLTRIVPPTTGAGAEDVAIDSATRFAYVANGVTGVAAYNINATTGDLALIAGSPFAAGATPVGLTLDPAFKFLYAVNRDSGNITGFALLSDGSLAAISTSPFTAGSKPVMLRFESSGKFAYAVDSQGTPGISIFSTSATAQGKLTPAGSVSAGSNPVALAITP